MTKPPAGLHQFFHDGALHEMTISYPPPSTRVRVREIATGEIIELWHVDAREYVATGHYEKVGEGWV